MDLREYLNKNYLTAAKFALKSKIGYRTEEKKAPVIEAFYSSLIDITVKVDERVYKLLVPNGVSYEEAAWACKEMASLVLQIKEKANPKAEEPEVVTPELVS